MKHATLTILLVTALALGCKSGGEGGGGEGGSGGGGEGGGGAPTTLKLGDLPIQATMPAGAKISEAPVGEGVMIQSADITMVISPADSPEKTLEEAKSDADMYSPKNLKEEKLADGWALMFENEGGAGKTYWLQAHRTIDGKVWECSVTSPTPEHPAKGLEICKSISK